MELVNGKNIVSNYKKYIRKWNTGGGYIKIGNMTV